MLPRISRTKLATSQMLQNSCANCCTQSTAPSQSPSRTRLQRLPSKKKKEKERRQRTTLAAQRVTDRPTSNSSAQVPPCDDDPSHAHALRGHTPSLPDPNCTCWGPYHGPVGTYYMAPMPALGHSCLLCKEARARGW